MQNHGGFEAPLRRGLRVGYNGVRYLGCVERTQGQGCLAPGGVSLGKFILENF